MNFGVANRNVNFASPLIERNVATHSHTHCSLIASIRGPTQVQSTQNTRSSSTKLTCSSIAAWLSPMLLPNNPFRSTRSTAAACSVPCPPAASAKPNVPAMSSATAARGMQLISAAALLSAALSKSPSRRSPVGIARALLLCGLGSLQVSASPVRISLRHVAHLQHTKQVTR